MGKFVPIRYCGFGVSKIFYQRGFRGLFLIPFTYRFSYTFRTHIIKELSIDELSF